MAKQVALWPGGLPEMLRQVRAHAATAQGVRAAENVVRKGPRRKVEKLVPSCIFTAPEIGSVGLTEAQAQEQKLEIKTGKFSFAALGKAMAAGETAGFVKWIADAGTDRLLGAHAIGLHATELIAEAALAIRGEFTTTELGRTIHSHPTLSESWMEAAHALHGECIHAPARKRRFSRRGARPLPTGGAGRQWRGGKKT